jgi:hypothetical protein
VRESGIEVNMMPISTSIAAWLKAYESIAVWLEGIALVAILFLDWYTRRQEHKETVAQMDMSYNQMRFSALVHLHQEIMSLPLQRALRFVYSRLPSDLADADSLSEEELEKIELVLNTYDLIGFRIEKGLIPRDVALETESLIVLRVWKRLQPFIELECKKRNHDEYKKYFKLLVERARELHPEEIAVIQRRCGTPGQTGIPSGGGINRATQTRVCNLVLSQ